jgi:hypothetical protein
MRAAPLDVLVVVLASLMAGGLLAAELGLVPTIRAAPAAAGIRLHVAFDHYVEWSMPALTIATLGAAIADLVVTGHRAAVTTLLGVGLAATVVVALVSQFVNVPLNARMRRWEDEGIPADHERVRLRWNRGHSARTLAGQVAVVCFVVALVLG